MTNEDLKHMCEPAWLADAEVAQIQELIAAVRLVFSVIPAGAVTLIGVNDRKLTRGKAQQTKITKTKVFSHVETQTKTEEVGSEGEAPSVKVEISVGD